MARAKIKRCRCGGRPQVLLKSNGCFRLKCQDCYATGPDGETRHFAVLSWNKEKGIKAGEAYDR